MAWHMSPDRVATRDRVTTLVSEAAQAAKHRRASLASGESPLVQGASNAGRRELRASRAPVDALLGRSPAVSGE
jgi:hypothetical protein